jgi:hypothetical protein
MEGRIVRLRIGGRKDWRKEGLEEGRIKGRKD